MQYIEYSEVNKFEKNMLKNFDIFLIFAQTPLHTLVLQFNFNLVEKQPKLS